MDARLHKDRKRLWRDKALVTLFLLISWEATGNVMDYADPLPEIHWSITSNVYPVSAGPYPSGEEACKALNCDGPAFLQYNQVGNLASGWCVRNGRYGCAQILSSMKCPKPAVNPQWSYIFKWDTATCYRSIPATLAIVLTGGTEVKPWHKKWDKEHKTSNLSYTATVKDSSGQPVSGVQVSVTVDVTQNSGGHIHATARPKGKLVIPPDPVKEGNESIQGTTDTNGVFSFTFGAEEASGEHSLKATCASCKEPATATIKVAVKGLMQLDPSPLNYELRGSLPEHPDNHYFSPAAMVKIINLAHEYRIDPDFKQLLKINDSSLIKGGSFDILQNWTSGSGMHGGHRKGVVVDINNYQEQEPDFENFIEYLDADIQPRWHSGGTAPHYHLLLLGKDR